MRFEFIETSIFKKQIDALLTAEEIQQLQGYLLENPMAGKVIEGSGGARKVRWALPGRGKRGGIRVIYVVFWQDKQIGFLLAYQKGRQENLSPSQVKQLREVIQTWQ